MDGRIVRCSIIQLVRGRGEGAIVSISPNFSRFLVRNVFPKMQNLGLKISHLGKFMDKIEILSSHNVICRKCLPENCNFLPSTSVTHDAARVISSCQSLFTSDIVNRFRSVTSLTHVRSAIESTGPFPLPLQSTDPLRLKGRSFLTGQVQCRGHGGYNRGQSLRNFDSTLISTINTTIGLTTTFEARWDL